jgi:hypothetical protein
MFGLWECMFVTLKPSRKKTISKPTEPFNSFNIYKTPFVSHGGATVGNQWKVVLASQLLESSLTCVDSIEIVRDPSMLAPLIPLALREKFLLN